MIAMNWVDTHAHLDMDPLWSRLAPILSNARNQSVSVIVVPGVKGPLQQDEMPAEVIKCWGIHPLFAGEFDSGKVKRLFDEVHYSPEAIGECGLDHEVEAPIEKQLEIFSAQLEIARGNKLPVMIHLRGFWDHGLAALKKHASGIPWVMHAFGGSLETAKRFLGEGAFISFAGSLCYPTARKAPLVAKMVPADRILLETDSPDIMIPGWKGEFNEPSALPEIARKLASIRGVPLEDLSRQIFENTRQIFPLLKAF